jgi:hypothetical protein
VWENTGVGIDLCSLGRHRRWNVSFVFRYHESNNACSLTVDLIGVIGMGDGRGFR